MKIVLFWGSASNGYISKLRFEGIVLKLVPFMELNEEHFERKLFFWVFAPFLTTWSTRWTPGHRTKGTLERKTLYARLVQSNESFQNPKTEFKNIAPSRSYKA